MRHFLRSVKAAWVYRYRLALSLFCALVAAALWGLNFTAIYPILKIFSSDQNLQQWVRKTIDSVQTDTIEPLRKEIDQRAKGLADAEKGPDFPNKEKVLRRASGELAALQARLEAAQRHRHHLTIAKRYIDDWFPEGRFATLALVLGWILVGVAIRGVFEFVQESLVGSVVSRVLFDVRNLFFRHAVRMDVTRFGEHGTHELMSRFTTDVEMMGTGLKTLFGRVVAEPLRALACIVMACFISWQLTFMFLVLVPVSIYILTRVGKTMKRATRRLLEKMSSIYQILHESFQGIRIVKGFCRESRRRRVFREATKEYYRRTMMVVRLDALAGPVVEVLGVAAIAGALLVGAYLVIEGRTTFLGIPMVDFPLEMEGLLQLYALLAAIADPVRKLSSVFTKIQAGAAASDRIYSYVEQSTSEPRTFGAERLPRHAKAIEFRDVSFAYDAGHPVLTGLNLRVEHGQIIALVGKNGCGKSTLLNLLPRFYEPTRGTVEIDGIDIREANLRSLRKQIAIVTQETFLFADTIRANIAFARPHATQEEIETAAKQANAHDFIERLAQGYDTRLGEAGLKVSVGQRQKLCLARAMLTNPSIVLLDEFTSAADAESEMEIHRVLRQFMKGRTCFVVTHRLNTLEIADRIVVIDDGKVAAQGAHADLLRVSPLYQRLYEAHFQRRAA